MTMRQGDRACRRGRVRRAMALLLALAVVAAGVSAAAEPLGPEQVIRAIVRANADRDLAGMARHTAKDADVVNYSIAGSKFVGWAAVEKALQERYGPHLRAHTPARASMFVFRKGGPDEAESAVARRFQKEPSAVLDA